MFIKLGVQSYKIFHSGKHFRKKMKSGTPKISGLALFFYKFAG